jgi:hypothetical protein
MNDRSRRLRPLAIGGALLAALGCASSTPQPEAEPAVAVAPAATTAVGAAEIDRLLLAGDVEGAERLALPFGLDAASATDPALALAVGRVRLLRNELDAAERWLQRALALDATGTAAPRLLAEAYRRRDRFAEAIPLLRAAGQTAEADMLASFAGQSPYELAADSPAETSVDFVQTDPLPLMRLRVNGKDGTFLLDTGGSDLLLDPEFAAAAGARTFGSREGTFGGGKKAETGIGRVDSLTLGAVTIRNLPVRTLPTRRFGAVCGGCTVDGVLGTVVLYHFLSTIDYPAGKLSLRRRGAAADAAGAAHRIRFWMAGDHYLLALGGLGDAPALPLLVDTGLAGMAFTAPPALFAAAGLAPAGPSGTGTGGGGAMTVTPVDVPLLALGDARREQLTGVIGPFPPQLETSQGVRIAGLISHEFFRRWALTFDFDRMELRLAEPR